MDGLKVEVVEVDPLVEVSHQAAVVAEQDQTVARVVEAGQAVVTLALSRRN